MKFITLIMFQSFLSSCSALYPYDPLTVEIVNKSDYNINVWKSTEGNCNVGGAGQIVPPHSSRSASFKLSGECPSEPEVSYSMQVPLKQGYSVYYMQLEHSLKDGDELIVEYDADQSNFTLDSDAFKYYDKYAHEYIIPVKQDSFAITKGWISFLGKYSAKSISIGVPIERIEQAVPIDTDTAEAGIKYYKAEKGKKYRTFSGYFKNTLTCTNDNCSIE